jgi:hypothetical protein
MQTFQATLATIRNKPQNIQSPRTRKYSPADPKWGIVLFSPFARFR